MNITTTNNAVIIEYNNTTVTGNKGVFTYTYDTPTASVSLFRDSKLIATGALSDIRINGESIDETNINEKLNPIFLTFSSGGGGLPLDTLYAGSPTVGGAANSVKGTLSFNSSSDGTGTSYGEYDGSTNVTIVPSELGITGGVGRKVIQVTDTKLRLSATEDLFYVWAFNENVPYGNFTLTEEAITATLNTTNQATIVLLYRASSASQIVVTLPPNAAYTGSADSKWYIIQDDNTSTNTTTFTLKGGYTTILKVKGLGDKRILKIIGTAN